MFNIKNSQIEQCTFFKPLTFLQDSQWHVLRNSHSLLLGDGTSSYVRYSDRHLHWLGCYLSFLGFLSNCAETKKNARVSKMLHSRPRHSLRNLFLKQYLQGRWFNIILPTQPTTIIPRIKQAELVVNVQNSNCRLARQSHNKWLHIKN